MISPIRQTFAQIAVLLALTAELFDPIPLDRMAEVEQAVHKAVADISAEVRERLDTADKLSDGDRETILENARKTLEDFSSNSKSKPDAVPKERSK